MQNIEIRKSVLEDITFLRECLLDPDVLGFYPMCNEKEVDDALISWKYYIKEQFAFTAIDENKNQVGMANLYINTFEKLKRQSLFSIVVDKKLRGKGIGTLLLKKLIHSAKQEYNLHVLHLEVYENNPAYNLYYRLGFRQYSVHKRFLKEEDGQYRDKINMQLILGE